MVSPLFKPCTVRVFELSHCNFFFQINRRQMSMSGTSFCDCCNNFKNSVLYRISILFGVLIFQSTQCLHFSFLGKPHRETPGHFPPNANPSTLITVPGPAKTLNEASITSSQPKESTPTPPAWNSKHSTIQTSPLVYAVSVQQGVNWAKSESKLTEF